MKKHLAFVFSLSLCLLLCGIGCKQTREESKGMIEEKVEKNNTGTLEEEIGEEVEKVPAPAEEWGGEYEEPILE